jgi:hypothetical protein
MEMLPCSGISARASELDQSRDAARIGRALAASPLAAMIEVFKTPSVEAGYGSAPNSGPWPPIAVNQHIARSGTRRRCYHYWSRDANPDSKRNPRRSECRAARQKQTRQNFRFHFLVLLTHHRKARGLPSLSGSNSVGNEKRAGRAAPLAVVFSRSECAGQSNEKA